MVVRVVVVVVVKGSSCDGEGSSCGGVGSSCGSER